MADLTFREQLFLSLIDKAALGVVIVGIGYLANRRLESRKARQALRAKMAEQQMPKIAQEMERLARVTASTGHLLTDCRQQATSVSRRSAELRRGLEGEQSDIQRKLAIQELSRTPDTYEDAFGKIWFDRGAEIQTTRDSVIGSWNSMSAQRFWLGDELAEILNRKYAALWYGLFSKDDALKFLTTIPALGALPSLKRGPVEGVRRWVLAHRDRRALERLGLSTLEVRTDVGRMIDHVSE